MVTRIQKQETVSEIKEILEDSKTVVVVHYRGMSVDEITELRKTARANGARVKVSKNTLASIAANDTQFKQLADLLNGPTAIISSQDEVAAAKVTADFAKDNEKLIIVGGAIEDKILDESGIKSLAKTPSLDESRGKIVGLLTAPASNLARLLQAPAGQVARTISARASQDA